MMLMRERGWVLIEVLAAVTVLAILVGVMAAGVIGIIDRGGRTERQADGLGLHDAGAAQAWTWGDRALRAAWSPGPLLRMRIATAGAVSDAVIGFWADGWLVAEVGAGEDGEAAIGGATWMGKKGRELVIRVRQDDGPWGPPWRTLVPDVTGIVDSTPDGVPEGLTNAEAVVHPRFAGNPRFEMDRSGAEIVAGPSGLPFLTDLSPVGPTEVKLDDAGQWWLSEPGRGLDVYF